MNCLLVQYMLANHMIHDTFMAVSHIMGTKLAMARNRGHSVY